MSEWLAMPPTGAPPIGLDRWLAAFEQTGQAVVVVRDDGETWIEAAAVRMRGFVSFEGDAVEAIDFDVHDPSTLALLESAATVLGWELYPEDDEEEDDD